MLDFQHFALSEQRCLKCIFCMAWNSATHETHFLAPPRTTRAMLSYARCSEQCKHAFQNSEERCFDKYEGYAPLFLYAYMHIGADVKCWEAHARPCEIFGEICHGRTIFGQEPT